MTAVNASPMPTVSTRARSGFILCVTPNPAIDKTAVVPGYRLGAIHRPKHLIALAGGKGLNAARVIARLGGEVHVCALLGGHSGRWVAEEVEREGIPLRAAWVEGETRTCLSIIDPETGAMTELYEAGPALDETAWSLFESAVSDSLAGADLAAFSGSLPTGAPVDGYRRLLQLAHARSVPTLIDTHGEPLRLALAARPHTVKINAGEAGDWAGYVIDAAAEAAAVARQLRRRGVENVVITLGRDGAVAAGSEGIWLAIPPQIEAVAPVGSGDSLLGAFALALLEGQSLPDALRRGAAAGAANALTLGPGMIEASQLERLVEQVVVRRWAE